MHVPAGERKQTGRAKETNLYSQGKYLIKLISRSIILPLRLQKAWFYKAPFSISIMTNHLRFLRLSFELLHTPYHIHWCVLTTMVAT